ncbi:hypothetical protein ABZW10_19880 [Kitasatospora sp. NPDC004723]|uniref:hypothetical protein n=1 Tax=Kitasatospora sp. NPDC004723 TaxID=3154288 RepID=UPI0033A03251
MKPRLSGPAACAAVALVLLTGCSGSTGGGSEAPTAGARASYDPPTAFDRARGVALPPDASALRAVLDGPTAYLPAQGSLKAVDLTDGKVIGTVNAQHPAQFFERPVIAEVGGARLAIISFSETIPGEGGGAPRAAAELVAMDTATHQAAWSLPLDLPDGRFRDGKYVTLLGVRGTTAVVSVTDGADALLLAVDLPSRKVLWSRTGFVGALLGDGQIVGAVEKDRATAERRVSAVNLGDGRDAWTEDGDGLETTVRPAGPNTVLVQGKEKGSPKRFARLMDASTGRRLLDLGEFPGICAYDGRSVTVCHDRDLVVAADPATGNLLWKLPDDTGTRPAPTVTTAWHGLVYGRTNTGPVTLDAATGAQRPGDPGIAPTAVSGYAGLAEDETRHVTMAHPATG